MSRNLCLCEGYPEARQRDQIAAHILRSMARKRRKIRNRPRRRVALWLLIPGVVLVAASLIQLPFGVPLSEGVAPAGLSIGPLLLISGLAVYFSDGSEPPSDPEAGSRQVDILSRL